MGQEAEPFLYERSTPGRRAIRFPSWKKRRPISGWIPDSFLRKKAPPLPELSELDVVRHFTLLSQRNYSVDTHFYPLGSCTMKYNPKANDRLCALPAFAKAHPFQPDKTIQGLLEILYDLERMLSEICGMDSFTLQPAAGAHGELTGILIAKAYLHSKGPEFSRRNKVLIPDSAHGTNPASAALCGFDVVTVKSNERGRVDLEDLKKHLGSDTALVMITVPNTLGLFEDRVQEIAEEVHRQGALLYMDGANLNALVGLLRPGDLGFDIVHVNVHKTFSIPHGGGGPGGGPVGVKKHLIPFLPEPRVVKTKQGYKLEEDGRHSVGRLRAFFGNTGALIRAYTYLKLYGAEELRDISEMAILHANYLRVLLKENFPAYVDQSCMHECVLQPAGLGEVKTLDVAKRLLDFGFYAPTVYFPLIVPEALMIEPTETESKQTLDRFVEAMRRIAQEAKEKPDWVKQAPHTTPVRRLDEVRAARFPNLRWKPNKEMRDE
ncbi:MAG: aminomethyl-transferring glycine dehydrogenase subunit GcvPB [Elusimicrobia bacterium]|nr:aminomethyl-transferring glycine dehydrogenase subunit GcvPB [Elusimicrobiota bacterium]